MVKKIGLVLASLLLITGLYVLAYPALNGALLEHEAESAAEVFLDSLPTPPPAKENAHESKPTPTPMPYPELYAAMLQYNQELYEQKQTELTDPWAYEAAGFDLDAFGMGNAVIGVISIPALELEMPIYFGASEDNMAAGTAVLGQTSLPIGGENTNCVIAGHRGWCGAAYFQFINKLEVGDTVSITNLWGTMQYAVTELRIIQPNEINEEGVAKRKNRYTLFTCKKSRRGHGKAVSRCEKSAQQH